MASNPKQLRKRSTKSRKDAIECLDDIIVSISRDFERAISIEAALEEANKIINLTPETLRPGAPTYSMIAGSLSVDLSITLSRLFEPVPTEKRKGGGKRPLPYKRERATIHLLVHLLKQKRCQDVLAKRAREWIPHMTSIADSQELACRKACKTAASAYSDIRRDRDCRQGLARLNSVRNLHLAHNVTDFYDIERPLYCQLFKIIDSSFRIIENALFAIKGNNVDYLELKRIKRKDAIRFWAYALRFDDEDHAQHDLSNRAK